jgi:hypothetical protein
MIDALVNRIKDAYFDLERDTARRGRFADMTQAFTPGAITLNPTQQAEIAAPAMPNQGMPMPNQGMPQAPAPQPSLLDQIGATR